MLTAHDPDRGPDIWFFDFPIERLLQNDPVYDRRGNIVAFPTAWNLAFDITLFGSLEPRLEMSNFIKVAAVAALSILPTYALAQSGGAAAGAATGAVGGAVVGGPVGAVVGGVGGAIVGGILDDADRPRVKEYVVQQRRPSVRYERDVVVGAELPTTVQTYDVPDTVVTTTKQRTGWHYAVVNDRTVIVDNKTRKIIQIID